MKKLACLCLLLCLSLLLSVGCAVSPQEDGADTSATVAETDGG